MLIINCCSISTWRFFVTCNEMDWCKNLARLLLVQSLCHVIILFPTSRLPPASSSIQGRKQHQVITTRSNWIRITIPIKIQFWAGFPQFSIFMYLYNFSFFLSVFFVCACVCVFVFFRDVILPPLPAVAQVSDIWSIWHKNELGTQNGTGFLFSFCHGSPDIVIAAQWSLLTRYFDLCRRSPISVSVTVQFWCDCITRWNVAMPLSQCHCRMPYSNIWLISVSIKWEGSRWTLGDPHRNRSVLPVERAG